VVLGLVCDFHLDYFFTLEYLSDRCFHINGMYVREDYSKFKFFHAQYIHEESMIIRCVMSRSNS
jgi:hypothetical protein